MRWPNHPAPGKAGIACRLTTGHHWPGLPEPGRYPLRTRMKRPTLCFLLALASLSPCVADVTKLPQEHRKVLEDSSRFREVHVTTNLPPAIVALCADNRGRLAEPDQKWEATDVISDPLLPRKRLIWAAFAGEYYVVHYE